MYSLCILSFTSCLLSLMLTPYARNWSIRLGLVDRPDGGRKLHPAATPRAGGLVILASYAGAYAILLLLPVRASEVVQTHLNMVWRLLPAVALILLTGLIDDRRPLRPWQKLAGQVGAATWAYAAGLRIFPATDSAVPAWCGFVLTIGWLVLCSNGFNLIDGMDGLATGIGITATLTTLFAGILHGDVSLGLATAPLAGCLIGFLRYNFSPASVFLGDSGSLLIGFLLGSFSLLWSQKSATMFGMAAPTMMLALPLLEVALSVVRRFLRGAPILRADRGHIHHRLLDRGFQPRTAALVLYGACGVGSMLSLLGSLFENRFAGLAIILFGACAWVGVQLLGYVELQGAGRFLLAWFRPMMSAHIKLKVLENSLTSARSIEDCWQALEQGGRSLGYSHVTAMFADRQFTTAPDHSRDATFWQMRLNLPDQGYVNITQREGSTEEPVLLIPFVEVIRRVLPGKLAQLEQAQDPAYPEAASAQAGFRNSNTRTVISSDCAVPSVNAATAS
jgi:UDP-GlcNAc:undecaprenyl-phosphate GlcNAc-1-phosphate transferase